MHDPQSIKEIVVYSQCVLSEYVLIVSIGNLLFQSLVLLMLLACNEHGNRREDQRAKCAQI